MLQSKNPATGELIAKYEEHTPAEADETIRKARTAFEAWRRLRFDERAMHFHRLAEQLRQAKDTLAVLMAREMGKPVVEGSVEIEKCAWLCEYYADEAGHILGDEVVSTGARKSYIAYQPLGVVLGLMPWNFPFWQVLRYAVPALMAGNTTVVKHANNVTGSLLALEQLFEEAEFPQDVMRALRIDIPAIEGVIGHEGIAAVTLTGSTQAGRAVGAAAGRALKPCVLELGGSDPFIVLEDADLDRAAELGATSRLIAGGQTCISAKRFIVPRSIQAAFEEKLTAQMKTRIVGDPLDPATTMGPLARVDLRDNLDVQVRQSISKGARVLAGGETPARPGAFYPPTVLSDCTKGMAVVDEETFGPVAAIIPVDDEAEAIRVANDTPYGLGAVVCSEDRDRAERIARDEIDAGCCFVNAYVKSDPRLPFGGIKESGFGRELGSYGIKEFVNIKTVYIE
jgi:succinate-semialdehyde dehydrogenase/glutarate-semialdehyde dehydrogenase